ncbi:hypothetical protein HMPREF9567_01077 [Cutibacterium acnes HL013PA1]|nr:hypothetical protein HMPREF9567_01077 [Cutibacterium acnes HL013PA1]
MQAQHRHQIRQLNRYSGKLYPSRQGWRDSANNPARRSSSEHWQRP